MCHLNDLSRLGGSLEDAKLSLHAAARFAAELTGEDPGICDSGWPAMMELHNQLISLIATLEALPGEEIDKAIDSAEAELDHLSDLADRASY